MLVSKMPIPIPSRKLIVDLVLRSGSPNTESLSPYDGFAVEILNQFSSFQGSIVPMLEGEVDYDADLQKPQEGKYFMGTKPNSWLTRLEDIDPSWVYAYITDKLVGLKLQSRGGVKEYNYNHRQTFSTTSEDGRELEESDLLVESTEDYSPLEISKAREQIPYILRRLHERSKVVRVHLLSIIIAYERAKKEFGKATPSPQQILSQGVYFMRSDGNVGTQIFIDDNKGTIFPPVSKWIRGFHEYSDAFFDNAMELLSICEVLHVDITKENPLDYQEEFISNLVVHYIAKNKAYVRSKRTGTNPVVLSALKSVSIDSFDITKEQLAKKVTPLDLVPTTMQVFLDARLLEYNKSEVREHDIAMFLTNYNYIMKAQFDMKKLLSKDGFFYLNRSFPVLLNVGKICTTDVQYKQALLHASGVVILLTDTNLFYYQDVNVLRTYCEAIIDRNADIEVFSNNTKFGYWKDGLV